MNVKQIIEQTNLEAGILDRIKVGMRVHIVTPHGSRLVGRAVMRGPHGWVLNLGGPHGTPGVATEANIVHVPRLKHFVVQGGDHFRS